MKAYGAVGRFGKYKWGLWRLVGKPHQSGVHLQMETSAEKEGGKVCRAALNRLAWSGFSGV